MAIFIIDLNGKFSHPGTNVWWRSWQRLPGTQWLSLASLVLDSWFVDIFARFRAFLIHRDWNLGCTLFCLCSPSIFPQVGFIPCNVSNIMEPYTFTVVNGLAGAPHSYTCYDIGFKSGFSRIYLSGNLTYSKFDDRKLSTVFNIQYMTEYTSRCLYSFLRFQWCREKKNLWKSFPQNQIFNVVDNSNK